MRTDEADERDSVSKYNPQIISQQPLPSSRMSWPDFKAEVTRSLSRRHTRDQSQCMTERRSIASRGSRRARSSSRPRALRSRRPTIGAPTDFRRSDASEQHVVPVDIMPRAASPPLRKLSPFRPLQLSIYIPGNELPLLLPLFGNAGGEKQDDVPEVPSLPEISLPPSALIKPAAASLSPLVRSNTSFSVPRKPLPGRTNSAEPPRHSTESMMMETTYQPRSYSLDHPRGYYMYDHGRPSILTTKSSQEFLEALNAPLPPLPLALSTSNQASSGERSIYRRASEQSLRLRTHLEERDALERECATITEERSPVSPLSTLQETSPTTLHLDTNTANINMADTSAFQTPTIYQLATLPRTSSFPHISRPASVARTSSSSSTLLDEDLAKLPSLPPSYPSSIASSSPSLTLAPAPATESSNASLTLTQRLSTWLTRSLTTHHSHLRSRRHLSPSSPSSFPSPQSNSHTLQHSASLSTSSPTNRKPQQSILLHSAPNERISAHEFEAIISHTPTPTSAATVTTPAHTQEGTGGPGRQRAATQSSVSTYVTTRGLSVDLEKFPIPLVRDVGVAI